MTELLLVGNPNSGKTTLFNVFTGDNQRVGNWPGVTVEKYTGNFTVCEKSMSITDLPGIYSLNVFGSTSRDEQLAANAIVTLPVDVIVNVVDACHLERHLYLTSQLLELGKPVIVVLTMMDIASKRGISIDTKALAKLLGCPVVSVFAAKKQGFDLLKSILTDVLSQAQPLELYLPARVTKILTELNEKLVKLGVSASMVNYYAYRILEGDATFTCAKLGIEEIILCFDVDLDVDIVLADARYQVIHKVVESVQSKTSDRVNHVTAKLDSLVLNRFLALPIFFCIIYLMFLFAIDVGGAFQGFFDIATDAIFVQGFTQLLQQIHMPEWVTVILAKGVGKGINTTLTFVPVLTAMFFFLSLLETSGYMARAAFVVDKVMRVLGLPGKSFVPLILGFGCNVPAIMAARTLDSERDRILTVLMTPFMSCSARLAIYAVFVAAFFPNGGQNIVFSLYFIGILIAVLTGFVVQKMLFVGKSSYLVLELPAYHKPNLRALFKETRFKLRYFVIRAGRLIIPVCVILSILNCFNINSKNFGSGSILALFGQWLTPIFAPMGLQQDNWPATVSLLTGMLAKEVVIGSLNTLYGQLGHLAQVSTDFQFWASLQTAFWSIPQKFTDIVTHLLHPFAKIAADAPLHSIYGIMTKRFNGKSGAYAYLLFTLLYIPCVSTMAVIRQETSRRWMWFSIIWSFIVAYFAAVSFYQIATFAEHYEQSAAWILLIILILGLGMVYLRYKPVLASKLGDIYAHTNS